MKARKFASLVLAGLLQIVPLARQWLVELPPLPGIAVVFRWGVGAVATLGAFDAVSGASTVITSPKTATGTNGVPFSYRITTGPEVANTFSAAPLPANLVCATNTGYITGIPVTNGTFSVKLTASDHNRPDRTVTTNLTLTIVPAVVLTPPTITTQPVSQTIVAGASATFSVVATGTAPLAYQWRLNSANIAGATSASLTATQAGDYSVLVSNAAGSVTSSVATLTVLVPPTIITQPQSQSVLAGNSATFTVAATGTAPLNYQWRWNGANISGATSASLVTTQAGNYSVVVSNGAGVATSATATLTIVAAPVAPTITTQPQSQTIIAGHSATFNVIATGTAPLLYQWLFNGAPWPGATSASLVTTQAGSYSVVVSNVAGSVTSATATLTVNPATAVFTLSVTGNGNVSPNLNGQSLVVGQTYTLTATPDAGHVFAGWSGSMSGADPTIHFVMSPGFALQAAFAPAPTTIAGGSYAGLFYEADGARYAHAGLITFAAAGRRLKGTLRIGATQYTFSAQGRATCPGQVPLDVTLQPDGAGSVAGTVGDGTWSANATADRAGNGAGRLAGTYDVPLPDGSTAVARVNTRGVLRVTGQLMNGRRVRERVTLAEDGTWPLYLPARDGAFIGWMKLANGSATGEVLWLPASP